MPGSSSRRPAPTPSAWRSCPPTTVAAEKAEGGDRDDRRRRGPGAARLARRPRRPVLARRDGPRGDAGFQQLVISRSRPGATGIDLDRKAFLARKRVEHELDAELATYFPSLSSRTLVYKGMLTTPQLVGVLPRPRRRALRERPAARAQPLLDEHVPVVAARPPVPLRRPQRRDQHRPGQPELDARPRGDARQHRPRRASSGRSRSARPARPTPPASTRCSSCSTSAGRPLPPRRADDDPRGVGEQRRDGRRPAGVLPLPLHGDGAVGRPGQRRRSPTAR